MASQPPNDWVAWFLPLALVLAVPVGAAGQEARKPNVIIILADDLGYGDLGFQGGKDIPTPHLDELAKGGTRCTDGYASCPVCCPTRAGLLTGRYQQRFGFEFNGGGNTDKPIGLPLTEKTLANLLGSAGYATGAVGKWHLGNDKQFHPLERGFGEFFGFVGGGHSYLPVKGEDKNPIVRGRERVEEEDYLTDAFAREAVAFIDKHKKKPFALYVAFNAVHVPLEATDKYLDRFPKIEQRGRRRYAAMLSAMDDAVGRIAKKVKDEGLEKDTLLFFLSDNGGHPLANAARNTPLRGEKAGVYEGGIRVPFVVKWAGRVPAGKTYGHPVISLDILPTALGAAGVAVPEKLSLDGVNLLPHLTGKDDKPPHESLFWRYGDHHAVRSGKWKLTVPAVDPPGLYDLSADVAESKDLSSAHPEKVKELTNLYEAWSAKLPAPSWPPGIFEKGARRPKDKDGAPKP